MISVLVLRKIESQPKLVRVSNQCPILPIALCRNERQAAVSPAQTGCNLEDRSQRVSHMTDHPLFWAVDQFKCLEKA